MPLPDHDPADAMRALALLIGVAEDAGWDGEIDRKPVLDEARMGLAVLRDELGLPAPDPT